MAAKKFNYEKFFKWTGYINPTYLGVDVENTSIIITQLDYSDIQGWTLKKVAASQLPLETIKNSEVVSNKSLLKSIKGLVSKAKLEDCNSVIATSSKAVNTNYAILPLIQDKNKIAMQAFNEAKKIYPEMYEKLFIDYAVIPDTEAEKDNKHKLLIVAAHKASLEPILDATKSAEILTKVIDVDYYALARSYELIKKTTTGKIIALLNVEANTALLVVLEDGRLIHHFHQGFNIPGYDKLIHFTLDCIDPSSSLERNSEPKKLSAIKLNPILENQLTNQLLSLLGTYSTQGENPKIDQIVLSGRSALIPSIDALLKERLGVDVVISNPFKGIALDMEGATQLAEKIGPACMMACGLAMRNNDDDKY